MEEELKSFILVWFSAIISVSYCYYFSHRIKAGVFRLISVLPVCVLFLLLPLFTSSVHLSLMTAMCLSWLANFKLILFSFDKGPLIPIPPHFPRFFCFACFPIKAQQNPKTQKEFPKWVSAIKVAIFGVVLHMYDYKEYMSPIVLLVLYSLHIYLELEIFFILLKLVFSLTLGFDLEPQSNEPLLATSLQDFWGRRWNLMVPAILRPVVYSPMRRVSERRVSSHWAMFPGILAAFIVSGLFHELLAFYLTREMPTGRFTMFFVLHGICTATELAVKKNMTKVMGRLQLSPTVSRLLTVGFLFVTSIWLFAPLLVRNGVVERFTNECVITTYFLKSKLRTLLGLT